MRCERKEIVCGKRLQGEGGIGEGEIGDVEGKLTVVFTQIFILLKQFLKNMYRFGYDY